MQYLKSRRFPSMKFLGPSGFSQFVVASLVCASGLVFGASAAYAGTAIIPVANASFESPVGDLNAGTYMLAGGWNSTAGAEIGNGTYNLSTYGALAPDGNQVQAVNYQRLWQNTGAALMPGATYTLSFSTACWDPWSATAHLYAAPNASDLGTSFGTLDYNMTTRGDGFHQKTLAATYAGDPGHYLSISMGPNGDGAWHAYDLVSVTRSYPDISHGRQVILNRGLQIQAEVAFATTPTSTDVNLLTGSNFTGLWFPRPASDSVHTLSAMPAGTLWSQMYQPNQDPRSRNLDLVPGQMDYKNNFTAFQYMDEADPTDVLSPGGPTILEDMTAAFRDWNTRYPNALAYANFYGYQPGVNTVAGLQSYMQAAKPDMITFDAYPGYSLPVSHRTEWYGYMQRYRTAALSGYTTDAGGNSGPIAYGQWLNTWRTGYDKGIPSESYVRLQQNASWAFGNSFLAAYHYSDLQSPNDVSVLFDQNGAPTAAYYSTKEANRQSRNLSPALVRLVSTDIRIIPGTTGRHWSGGQWVDDDLPLPWDPNDASTIVSAWAPHAQDTDGYTDYITGITPLGNDNGVSHIHSDVLIGYFRPLLADNPGCTFADGLHFMIVNGAAGMEIPVDANGVADPAVLAANSASALAEQYHITFDFLTSGFDSLVRLSRDTGQVELVTLAHYGAASAETYYLDLTLEGGTGDLFAFWNSSNPLPTIPEPGTFTLLGAALVGILAYVWRKRR